MREAGKVGKVSSRGGHQNHLHRRRFNQRHQGDAPSENEEENSSRYREIKRSTYVRESAAFDKPSAIWNRTLLTGSGWKEVVGCVGVGCGCGCDYVICGLR